MSQPTREQALHDLKHDLDKTLEQFYERPFELSHTIEWVNSEKFHHPSAIRYLQILYECQANFLLWKAGERRSKIDLVFDPQDPDVAAALRYADILSQVFVSDRLWRRIQVLHLRSTILSSREKDLARVAEQRIDSISSSKAWRSDGFWPCILRSEAAICLRNRGETVKSQEFWQESWRRLYKRTREGKRGCAHEDGFTKRRLGAIAYRWALTEPEFAESYRDIARALLLSELEPFHCQCVAGEWEWQSECERAAVLCFVESLHKMVEKEREENMKAMMIHFPQTMHKRLGELCEEFLEDTIDLP